MYGWRARIGFIVPSSTTDTPAYEFYRMAPPGVTFVGTIMGIQMLTDKDIGRALQRLEEVSAQYAKDKVDIVNLGGSPPVTLGGKETEQELIDCMERASGTQSTTTQTGAVMAMRALGITNIGIASPFSDHQNEKLKTYLEASGFTVEAMKGIGEPLENLALLPNEKSYRQGVEVAREAKGKINGIYLPCAQWPVIENIAILEKDTNLPVVASLQGMLWHCLRRLGIRESIQGYGKLFDIETLP